MLQATSSKPNLYANHIYKIMRPFKSVIARPKKVIFESLKAVEDVIVSAFPGMAGLLTGAITPDDFIETWLSQLWSTLGESLTRSGFVTGSGIARLV